ncbi:MULTISPECIES: hypothetical protein [Myroides]|uniref:hypothetical protein n=1 Tax=Myroides TaxID=76831 RepID=UPI00028A0E09|nr:MULTISPECIES: hypothetical protein [Myroides]MBB1139020.1 hypothetical protein [Myroides sp. WP-1]MDM1035956.1 hypothetical protein [Myroides odoratimimus]MDM1060143.1 hypothetical protein [Myroides odoratimimus]
MDKIKDKIKEYWKDPVWSKVIASGVLAVLGGLFYLMKKIILSISLKEIYESIRTFLLIRIEISMWIFLLTSLVLIILIINYLLLFLSNVKKKIFYKENSIKEERPNASEPSTTLFSSRMAKTFPGLRGLEWFNSPSESTNRLQMLLQNPLTYKNGTLNCESDPIWWFRGTSSFFISKFNKIGRSKVLMDISQLKIKKIAAYHGDSYFRDFVYVETSAELPTGVREISKEEIQKYIKEFGYYQEEYGLIKYLLFWKKPIKREHYEDGATKVWGKIIDASDAELRIRYLSKYNFIIAAKGSPYNSRKFEDESKYYLDGLLTNEVDFDEFFTFLKTFKKKEYY